MSLNLLSFFFFVLIDTIQPKVYWDKCQNPASSICGVWKSLLLSSLISPFASLDGLQMAWVRRWILWQAASCFSLCSCLVSLLLLMPQTSGLIFTHLSPSVPLNHHSLLSCPPFVLVLYNHFFLHLIVSMWSPAYLIWMILLCSLSLLVCTVNEANNTNNSKDNKRKKTWDCWREG